MHKQLMGGRFCFRSSSQALMHLAEAAYGGVAPHRFAGEPPEFSVDMCLLPRPTRACNQPPKVRTRLHGELLHGYMNDGNFVLISPRQRRALLVASEDMLAHACQLRYELLEFAVFLLAARTQGLVPLHGAGIGQGGRGLLVLGASGAGKSTLALHGMLEGLELLAEDAVFVQPRSLMATGVANYLHLQASALDSVDHEAARRWIAGSPVIRRRSGVHKFEADLRRAPAPLHTAQAPMQVAGTVLVSSEHATDPATLLTRVAPEDIAATLAADQAYATRQAGWHDFAQRMARLPMYRLRRGPQPRAAVAALRDLLGH